MSKFNLALQSAFAMAIAWPTLLQGGIDLSEMDQIAARRTAIANREAALRNADSQTADVSAQLAALKSIQSEMILGPSGLKKDVETWLGQADGWVAQWRVVAQASLLINKDNLGSFGSDVQDKLKNLNTAYLDLAKAALQITDKSSRISANLKGRAPLEEGNWPQRAEFVKALNAQQDGLTATVDSLTAQLDAAKVDALQKKMTVVSDFIIDQITLLALQFPELKQQVEDAKAMIAFEKEIDPKVAEYEFRLNQGISLVNFGFLFTAKQKEQELIAANAELLKQVGAFQANDAFRKSKADRINEGLKRFQDNLKAKIAQGSMAKAVANLAKTERPRLTRICRENTSWSGVDCETLRVLNAVDASFIKLASWKQADLAYFEQMLYKAGQGSTIVNTGAGQ